MNRPCPKCKTPLELPTQVKANWTVCPHCSAAIELPKKEVSQKD